ncbi:hypothetical protein J4Q44_G00116060 [Coregonus suidteri]|uniref:Lon protease homolog 2, peroxisomal n=1 Tax=Coregonus suidteri TaxID=861788 RepID=A0AAN8LU12_9TELE
MRISVETARNMHLVKNRLLKGTSLKSTIIGVIPNTRDPEHDTEDLPPLHSIGTAGLAVQVVGSNWPKPHYTLLITGLCRFRVAQLLKEGPFPMAEVEQLDKLEQYTSPKEISEAAGPEGELGELSQRFYQAAVQLVGMLDMSVPVVAKLRRLLDSLPRETLPDVLVSMIRTSNKEKLQVLDAVSLEERFKKTLPLLTRQIEGLKLLQKTRKPRPDDDKRVLAVRKGGVLPGRQFSLDEEGDDEDGDDTAVLERKVKGANMPEPALRVCLKELKRLKKMPQSMPEYALTRNYLDLMVELPWSKSTTDCLDIHAARVLLDNDHYAMEKLKRRVLEYLAVRQLKSTLKGPILCFVGPPGVGKTSVGRSIARTLGREFHRIALGGVCDQSDIRGHRRTYVGSMPGRIINGLKTVGVNNPVFLLDEVDKLGKSLQGDPASALLEVSERLTLPGVAVGLAWTPLGGEIMFVEASRMEGEGQLTLTGQLGDVMKESAHLAMSWLRSNAKTYQLTNMVGGSDPLEGTDIHLHFPAGAVTKDGPSAGVTMVTVLASLFSGRLVRSDVAMTGEITLRGLVLPVGGIKDKVLAAHRAGVKRVIIPKRNEKDLEEIPANVRVELDFVTARNLDEVLNAAFDGGFPGISNPLTLPHIASKL